MRIAITGVTGFIGRHIHTDIPDSAPDPVVVAATTLAICPAALSTA